MSSDDEEDISEAGTEEIFTEMTMVLTRIHLSLERERRERRQGRHDVQPGKHDRRNGKLGEPTRERLVELL